MTPVTRLAVYWLLLLTMLLPAPARSDGAEGTLEKGLVHERRVPPGIDGQAAGSAAVAYVLGGRQESLLFKLKTAGRLAAAGTIGKVLMLHKPGITEFSPRLGRNLSNDEWALEKLEQEGIPAEKVEFVEVSASAFSTLAEAREITALVRSRGVRRLILISSPHHTERVWRSFSRFNRDNGLDLYVYGSQENAGSMELLSERMKLWIYSYFAIPVISGLSR